MAELLTLLKYFWQRVESRPLVYVAVASSLSATGLAVGSDVVPPALYWPLIVLCIAPPAFWWIHWIWRYVPAFLRFMEQLSDSDGKAAAHAAGHDPPPTPPGLPSDWLLSTGLWLVTLILAIGAGPLPDGGASPPNATHTATLTSEAAGVGVATLPTLAPLPITTPTPIPAAKVTVPTPSVDATRLELVPGPPGGPSTLNVFMKGPPNPEACYWVLREDLDYPARNPARPELYPQALSSWNRSDPYLQFAVFLQIPSRRYHLTVIECGEGGDNIVRPVAERWREEAFLDQFPRGCAAVIDGQFSVPK